MRSGPGAARTILLFHIISARPSKQPRLVRTFLKVHKRPRLAMKQKQKGKNLLCKLHRRIFLNVFSVMKCLRSKKRLNSLATTGNPWTRGMRWVVQSHTRPCLRSRVRQGWRGGKDQDVRTGLIHLVNPRGNKNIMIPQKS